MTPSTLVVFGAGASVDCMAPGISVKMAMEPPLVSGLVEAVRPYGAKCAQLLELLSAMQARSSPFDFEGTLRSIYSERGAEFEHEFVALRNAISERMSKADAIGSQYDTLYTRLFARIRGSSKFDGREVLVLNLNYDRLAEHAINGRRVCASLRDFIRPQNRIKLYHAHGNAAWRLPTDPGIASSLGAEQRAGRTSKIAHSPTGGNLGGSWGDAALALPMSGDYAGKTAWPQSHEDDLLARLANVDQVIVIGWRAADAHIVEMVAERVNPSVIDLVNLRSSDLMEMNVNLRPWFGGAVVNGVEGGFRSYVESVGGRLDALFPLPNV